MANEVFAFTCSVVGQPDWAETINARSAGKARAEYWRRVSEPWPSIPFTAIRARNVGQPHTSDEFLRTAQYRGLPDVRCGQRVTAGRGRGVIVGNNSSANFDVLFDDDSPEYAGLTLNVHPNSLIFASPERA